MRSVPFVVIFGAVACGHAAPPSPIAPPPPPPVAPVAGPEWDALRGLLGTWQGEDPARHTTGRFTLEAALGGKVLVRHNIDETPRGRHEDLMIIFHAPSGLRATYFDNEAHVINYAITATGNQIALVSDDVPGAPRFKLDYELRGPDDIAIDFSIAPPGAADFQHFTGGTVRRVPH